MSDLFWLADKQMRRIEPYFPLSHGIPRVGDRRVLSGIIFVIRNGLPLERFRKHPALNTHQTLLSSSEKLAWVSTETREDQSPIPPTDG